MKPEDTYIPFGPEWEKEMMKLPKKLIIEMYGKSRREDKESLAGVREALEDLIDAIPKSDWWSDKLTRAVEKGKAALGNEKLE